MRNYLGEMLVILGKPDCKTTLKRLSQEFYATPPKKKGVPYINLATKEVLTIQQNAAYTQARDPKLLKKLKELEKSLSNALLLVETSEVKKEFSRDISVEIAALKRLIAGTRITQGLKRGRGRPSQDAFYRYIFACIKLYEELTGSKFTIMRSEGVILTKKTNGYEFIQLAVASLLNEAAHYGVPLKITSSNIYNACESAQKLIRKNR